MTIKCLAFDLDGTLLLDESKKMDPRTVDSIKRAMDQGIHIVIASGRDKNGCCIFPFNYFRLDARKPHVFVYFSPLFTSLSEIHYGNESFCIREPLIPIFHNLF